MDLFVFIEFDDQTSCDILTFFVVKIVARNSGVKIVKQGFFIFWALTIFLPNYSNVDLLPHDVNCMIDLANYFGTFLRGYDYRYLLSYMGMVIGQGSYISFP